MSGRTISAHSLQMRAAILITRSVPGEQWGHVTQAITDRGTMQRYRADGAVTHNGEVTPFCKQPPASASGVTGNTLRCLVARRSPCEARPWLSITAPGVISPSRGPQYGNTPVSAEEKASAILLFSPLLLGEVGAADLPAPASEEPRQASA